MASRGTTSSRLIRPEEHEPAPPCSAKPAPSSPAPALDWQLREVSAVTPFAFGKIAEGMMFEDINSAIVRPLAVFEKDLANKANKATTTELP